MNTSTAQTSWTEINDRSVVAKAPLISVHMLAYNHEPYLVDAIQGVLQQQTQYPYELIIGEDCSSDKTRAIALDFQRRHPDRVRVLLSETNAGAFRNYDRVLKQCRGKYIAFCEGDDYWHDRQKLEKQVSHLEGDSGVSLVHSDCDFLYSKSKRRISRYHRSVHPLPPCGMNMALMLLDMRYSIVTCTTCVRRDVLAAGLRQLGDFYSEKYPMCDLQAWFACALHGRLHYLDDSLATRVVLSESAGHSKNYRKMADFSKRAYQFRLECLDRFFRGSDAQAARASILSSLHSSLLWLALLCRDSGMGSEAFAGLKQCQAPIGLKRLLVYHGTQNRFAGGCVHGYHWLKQRILNREQYYY